MAQRQHTMLAYQTGSFCRCCTQVDSDAGLEIDLVKLKDKARGLRRRLRPETWRPRQRPPILASRPMPG